MFIVEASILQRDQNQENGRQCSDKNKPHYNDSGGKRMADHVGATIRLKLYQSWMDRNSTQFEGAPAGFCAFISCVYNGANL